MTKRIICCENPAYINLKDKQLQIKLKNSLIETMIIPIEDIGILIIDNNQITITSATIQELQENKVALIICDNKHMPSGLMLPVDGNSIQQERISLQIKMKQTLKNNLWKQIVLRKIKNQAVVLEKLSIDSFPLIMPSNLVTFGDKTNREAIAAVYYWKNIFKKHISKFHRDKNGTYPNNLLNYGYSILRSIVAKSIVSAGLSPSIGVFHKNQFNTFCLADDLIEPFRPFVDKIVYDIIEKNEINESITKEHKKTLLNIPLIEVMSKNKVTTLTIAIQNLIDSFIKIIQKEQNKLDFPEFLK